MTEYPRAVPDPETLTPTRFVSEPILFCCFILIFPRFYLISFLIYLFICLSVCLMVAILMSVSTFFEQAYHDGCDCKVRFYTH